MADRERQRLWVVSELYYPEETSTGYYLTRIAEGLAHDADVKVLCGQPNYSARGIRAPKRETHNGVEIFRVLGTTLNKNVIAFRLMNMLTLGAGLLINGLRRFGQGDRVLVVTTPPAAPFMIAIASLIRGSGYTLLIHDNYPEILVAAKKAKPDSFLTRSIHRANRWLYKHARSIIVVGRDMKELVTARSSGLDVPVDVIPNWAELETVEPRPRQANALLAELGLGEKLVFLYAGNMGHPNDVETILATAERLEGGSDIHFIFLGSGAKLGAVRREIESKRLSNVTLLDPRPRSEQTTFLNACDVALVSLVAQMKGVSMPSRTYNILAAGKPILALTEPGSELDRVISEENVGWSVAPGDVDGFEKAVLQIRDDRAVLGSLGENARAAALSRYSLEAALAAYKVALLEK